MAKSILLKPISEGALTNVQSDTRKSRDGSRSGDEQ
jgi:hypothetical protein